MTFPVFILEDGILVMISVTGSLFVNSNNFAVSVSFAKRHICIG